jgi:hypothetical protein
MFQEPAFTRCATTLEVMMKRRLREPDYDVLGYRFVWNGCVAARGKNNGFSLQLWVRVMSALTN